MPSLHRAGGELELLPLRDLATCCWWLSKAQLMAAEGCGASSLADALRVGKGEVRGALKLDDINK